MADFFFTALAGADGEGDGCGEAEGEADGVGAAAISLTSNLSWISLGSSLVNSSLLPKRLGALEAQAGSRAISIKNQDREARMFPSILVDTHRPSLLPWPAFLPFARAQGAQLAFETPMRPEPLTGILSNVAFQGHGIPCRIAGQVFFG